MIDHFPLTFHEIAGWPLPGMTGPQQLQFSPDSGWLSYLAPERSSSQALSLWGFDLTTRTQKILAQPPRLSQFSPHEILRRERQRQSWDGITSYTWVPGTTEPQFLVPDETGFALGSPTTRPIHIRQSEGGLDAKLFADGKRLALVRDGNIQVVPIEGSAPPIVLTQGAQPGLTYGLSDYISAEEFGRQQGFWIRPDGAFIALIEADVRHIKPFPIVHSDGDFPSVEPFPYPLTGTANPNCRLGVVPSSGGDITWFDLGPDAEYLAEVTWTPTGRLAVLHLDRSQRHLHWTLCDPITGSVHSLYQESLPTYVNLPAKTVFLSDGGALTTSESSGFCHLLAIDPDGRARTITQGRWTVTDIVDVDESNHSAAILATLLDARQRHLFKVDLDHGTLTQITDKPGVHQVMVSPDHQWWIDRHESLRHSPKVTLRHRDPSEQILIGQAATTADDLHLVPPEWVELAADDGSQLFGALYRPSAGVAPHPLIISVYGGPHAQRVVDAWALTVDLEAQYLAQQGFLVLKVDNRGSANRGKAFEEALYQRFGTVEVRDQVRAAAWAVRFADADPDRIGITGWSYGGYLTLMAMATAPNVFRVGVAGAPVTDFRLYDTAYTERYMGHPDENPDGYRQASVFSHLDQLPQSLLIIHGVIDENVHFHHSLRLIEAAMAHGIVPELMALPSSRHLPRGQSTRYAICKRRLEFLQTHLQKNRLGSEDDTPSADMPRH